jgi:hypothetical protein
LTGSGITEDLFALHAKFQVGLQVLPQIAIVLCSQVCLELVKLLCGRARLIK